MLCIMSIEKIDYLAVVFEIIAETKDFLQELYYVNSKTFVRLF